MITHVPLRNARAVLPVVVTLIVCVWGGAASSQAPPPPQPPAYTILDLGTLCVPTPEVGCGPATSFGSDVNNWGQVVGASSLIREIDGLFFGFMFGAFRTGGNQPINPSTDRLIAPFLFEAFASAVNDSGTVVGRKNRPDIAAGDSAFVFTGAGPMMTLPSVVGCFPSAFCSAASGINESGTVVGTFAAEPGPLPPFTPLFHAFRWTSVVEDLGALPGADTSAASDINDFGLVVGSAATAIGRNHAAIFGGLSPISLGTLCTERQSCESFAYGVNNGGAPDPTSPTTAQIVGESDLTPTGPRRAFVLQLGPTSLGMQDLGALCGADCGSAAYDINDLGRIVGDTEVSSTGTIHAFLYKDNQMTDLNTVLAPSDQTQWVLTSARGINDFGQIAGTGTLNGKSRAYLLTPPLSAVLETAQDLAAMFLNGKPPAISQSLLAKLNAAATAFDRQQIDVAQRQMVAFELEVEALAQGRVLTETQGTKLLAGAALIRRLIDEAVRR